MGVLSRFTLSLALSKERGLIFLTSQLCYNYRMQYKQENIKLAKELRSNMTNEESKLWYHLRAKRFFGLKFKRQVPIGNYIVDFLCPDKKLIIELDGGQHNEDNNISYDSERTKYLESEGYTVLRFWNNDVNKNTESVLETIKNTIGI